MTTLGRWLIERDWFGSLWKFDENASQRPFLIHLIAVWTVMSYYLNFCVKRIEALCVVQCDLKCTLVVSLHLEPITKLLDLFIDPHTEQTFYFLSLSPCILSLESFPSICLKPTKNSVTWYQRNITAINRKFDFLAWDVQRWQRCDSSSSHMKLEKPFIETVKVRFRLNQQHV